MKEQFLRLMRLKSEIHEMLAKNEMTPTEKYFALADVLINVAIYNKVSKADFLKELGEQYDTFAQRHAMTHVLNN